MPSPDRLLLFALAAGALIAIPGPAVLFVVTRALGHGRRTGLVSVLGVEAGALIHVVAATVGLSALIAASATAFTVVKLGGAAYLVLVGLRTWFGRRRALAELSAERRPPPPAATVFRQGVIVSILNPKTALFFLAFLPQFVDPHHGRAWLQVAVLGLTFAALGMITDSLWAIGAGTAGEVLRRSRRFALVQRYVSGTVFVGLGVATAFAGTHRSP